MRLNIDCIRDILLIVEANCNYNHPVPFCEDHRKIENIEFMDNTPDEDDWNIPKYQIDLLTQYSFSELFYHLNYCLKANLLQLSDINFARQLIIEDLTPEGHEFLANIRHKTIFEKTKVVAKKIGVESLPSFIRIAESTTSEIIKGVINAST